MCDAHKTCMSCPLRPLKDNASFFACSDAAKNKVDEAIDIVQRWSDEHPVKQK